MQRHLRPCILSIRIRTRSIHLHIHVYIHSFAHARVKLFLKITVRVKFTQIIFALARTIPLMALFCSSCPTNPSSYSSRENTRRCQLRLRRGSQCTREIAREVTRKKRIKLRVIIQTKKDAIRTKITQPHRSEKVIVLCAGEL